jgi:Tol biopolymer transport system component
VFGRCAAPGCDLYVIPAAGGTPTRITHTDAATGQGRFSPDGGQLVWVSNMSGDTEIYTSDADGSNIRRLTTSPGPDVNPAWSPDGRKIAFVRNNDIYTMDIDGTGLLRLTTDGATNLLPSWSPDGQIIAYQSLRDGSHDVYTIGRNGGTSQQLTSGTNPVGYGYPTFSGLQPRPLASGLAVFHSNRHGNEDIIAMRPDGTGLWRLTSDPNTDLEPALSRDGERVAFVSYRSGSRDIWIMDADGSGQTRVFGDGHWTSEPDFHPDGNQLTIGRCLGPGCDVYVLNLTTSQMTRVTTSNVQNGQSRWSPDGSELVWVSDVTGDTELYIGTPDGLSSRRLTTLPGPDFFPAWSPLGDEIAFSHGNDLYLVHASGTTAPRQVTSGGGVNQRPVWSADGQQLMFQSSRNGQFEVYRIRKDGTGLTRVTENSAADGYPSWR